MAEVPIRYLSRADVLAAGGADMQLAVQDLRDTLALLRAGQAEMPSEISVPIGTKAVQARAYALPARLAGAIGVVGVKWTAHRPDLADGAPRALALTLLNDLASGRPVAVVESALLTAIRTAGTTAAALACLSQPPRRVAVIGAGVQARAHLRMLAALYPALERVTIWNRTPAHIADFESTVAVATNIDAALEGADVVLCCTSAATPILDEGAVRPGRTIVQVGYNEVSFAAIAASDAVVVDLWGPFCETSAKSLFRMYRAGRFPPERVAADLAAVMLDGWRASPDSRLYISTFGLNLFDIALAARVLRQAAASGIGTVLPLAGGDWA